MSDEILKEFNAEYVSRFLSRSSIKSSFFSDGAKCYKTFSNKYEISRHSLIRLDNQIVIYKEFCIQIMNNYIT
ncbi:MAG: hypothetical protein ACTS73_07570 [Arsenophonus sp. NEOnobi-MAG3]